MLLLVACLVGPIFWFRVIREQPGRRAAYTLGNRAQELYAAGDLPAAADFYRRAAEQDPSTPHYAAGLAVVLLRIGRLDEAEAAALAAEAELGHRPDYAKALMPTLGQVRDAIRRRRAVNRRRGAAPRQDREPSRIETTPPSRPPGRQAPPKGRPFLTPEFASA